MLGYLGISGDHSSSAVQLWNFVLNPSLVVGYFELWPQAAFLSLEHTIRDGVVPMQGTKTHPGVLPCSLSMVFEVRSHAYRLCAFMSFP